MGGQGSGRKRKSAAAAAIAPAIETAPTTKSALLELSALEIPGAGAGENPDAEKARAALESAAPPVQPPAQSDSEVTQLPAPQKNTAGESSEKSSSAAAAGPGQEKKKKITAPEKENLSGKQYAHLKNEQLRTLLAETKNELAQLRTEKNALEVVARGELANHLANAIAESAHAIANGAAAMWGQHMKLEGDQASRLGKAWAPVVAHYMPDVVQHAPLVGAVVATSSIVLEKYALHKALVATAHTQTRPREAA